MPRLTPTEVFMAFCVEVVRQLWDRGLYRQNKYARMCHDQWFDVWTIWRTGKTMEDVDRQIEEMFYEPEIEPPVYYEEQNGETPLGGAMGIRNEFTDHDA